MACSLVVAIAATSSSSVHGKTGGFNRPQLLPYDPQAPSAAIVVASDGFARFTVLTDRLIRMEYARVKGQFEDRASLAVLHRNTSTPAFTHAETSGVLTIATDEVVLKYTVGKGGAPLPRRSLPEISCRHVPFPLHRSARRRSPPTHVCMNTERHVICHPQVSHPTRSPWRQPIQAPPSPVGNSGTLTRATFSGPSAGKMGSPPPH